MVRQKVDNRFRILIENGICSGYRTMFVVVGEKSRNMVYYLHHMLSKALLKQPTVLWCYKKELALSSNRKKRLKQIKKKQEIGNPELKEEDPFEMFVSYTDIRYCYYKETHKILGNTFKMCILQDFESLTPNILCRTIETVEGGGVIVILLQTISSLKQLYTLNMDVHSRYRTEVHQHIVPRFNERFILSLTSCPTCIVLSDEMQILPISSLTRDIVALPLSHTAKNLTKEDIELKEFKRDTRDDQPLGPLIGLCKTLDQAKVVSQFMTAITEKTLTSTITLTAARGRGKSAAMGLAMAGAIAVGYANMYVTSPSPENLKTFFEFLLKGIEALDYEKHLHYQTLVSSKPGGTKCIMRVTITKNHQQIVQYISPSESDVLGNAELLVIDEAAAIPLPQVQAIMGPYLIFLASTVSGYEGTGRSLTLKFIKQLRDQSEHCGAPRKLVELGLNESIRYKNGDPIEKWLHDLLCLESLPPKLKNDVPLPESCQLYYVNRDTLFSYHKISETFLSSMMSLLVSSHYRNSPDDLQILSDAPAHHIFVLLPPKDPNDAELPPILCVIQVSLEGKISKKSTSILQKASSRRAPGDLIPWTVSNLFQDDNFPILSGARVARIATHPDQQGRGYGSRAMQLLERYYNQSAWKASIEENDAPRDPPTISAVRDSEVELLNEKIVPREQTHPLLLSIAERPPEPLHYLGVSFGASYPLLRFWKKAKFSCLYLSQVKNVLTGEYTCLLLKVLNEDKVARDESWLRPLCFDFRKRLLNLFSGPFRDLESTFALSIVTNKIYKTKPEAPPLSLLKMMINEGGRKRLDAYCRHQCDLPRIADVLHSLASLYFQDKIPGSKLKPLQMVILLGVALQMKHPSVVAKELTLDMSLFMPQLHSLMSSLNKQLTDLFESLSEEGAGESDGKEDLSCQQIIKEVAAEVSAEMEIAKRREIIKDDNAFIEQLDLMQYAIKAKETKVPLPNTKKMKRVLQANENKRAKIKKFKV